MNQPSTVPQRLEAVHDPLELLDVALALPAAVRVVRGAPGALGLLGRACEHLPQQL